MEKRISREQIKSGVYAIRSQIDSRVYVGSSVNVHIRFNRHSHHLNIGNHPNAKLQNFYNKYGNDSLVFELIEYCDKSVLIEREQFHIDNTSNLFNIRLVAESNLGLSCKNKGKPSGVVFTQETRDKISKAHMGNKYNLGRHPSEETKRKISNSCKGRVISEETRLKLSKSGKGRAVSDKVKKIMSEKLKGNTNGSFISDKSRLSRNIKVAVSKTEYKIIKYDLDGVFIDEYMNSYKAEIIMGYPKRSIWQVLNRNKISIYKGFLWKKVRVKH